MSTKDAEEPDLKALARQVHEFLRTRRYTTPNTSIHIEDEMADIQLWYNHSWRSRRKHFATLIIKPKQAWEFWVKDLELAPVARELMQVLNQEFGVRIHMKLP